MIRSSALGSWPGSTTVDVREAVRVVRDTLTDTSHTGGPGIPYLPEVPGRGPGADMIGRTAAMLVELPVDLQPSGWRLVDRSGRDQARATSYLRSDLDQLAEAYDGYRGVLKLQACGPWTLAAELRLNRGERVVLDRGACRDLAASLIEGLWGHIADVRRLLPGVDLVVQLDEPLLPSVVAGELATSSGFGRLRAVDPEDARRTLAETISAIRRALARPEAMVMPGRIAGPGVDVTPPAREAVLVHCCAPDAPIGLLRDADVDGLSLDVALLGSREWESVAGAVEAGLTLWAGALPTEAPDSEPDVVAAPVLRAWRELGLDRRLLDTVVLTPACGLAGLGPQDAVRVHRTLPRAAAALAEAAG